MKIGDKVLVNSDDSLQGFVGEVTAISQSEADSSIVTVTFEFLLDPSDLQVLDMEVEINAPVERTLFCYSCNGPIDEGQKIGSINFVYGSFPIHADSMDCVNNPEDLGGW